MKAIQLKTEYLVNPLGIDIRKPRLTWNCDGGTTQKSFQVRVYDEYGNLFDDSGIMESSNMYYTYQGVNLSSRQKLLWDVMIIDESGEIEKSEIASFEMGLLNENEFKASWISGRNTETEERLPADYFLKSFEVNENIIKARLYITALGTYEVHINDQLVSNFYLAPGSQQYTKRLYYQVYDVTSALKDDNDMVITLGDGWYKGKLGCDGDECLFGKKTMVKAQLEITNADGTIDVILTDETFLWSNDGTIRYNDLKDGVILDFTKSITYNNYAEKSQYSVSPSLSVGPKLIVVDHIKPQLLISPSGKTILDFQQNFAGSISFSLKGKKNQKVTLKAFEVLNHGEYCDSTFRTLPNRGKSINQEITMTLSGSLDTYFPNFHYFGFRYVLVEGLEKVNENDFTGVVVSSDLPYETTFASSNQLLNQFVKNTIWSLKSNFFDVPTDCPHREKAGWTGDAQIIAKTACYLTDPMSFYRKWLKDIRDCQREDGRVHNINPKVNPIRQSDMLHGSTGWADAVIIIPYTLWKFYGDHRIIEENLEMMLDWKKYVMKLASDKSVYDENNNNPLKELYLHTKPKDSSYNKYLIESGFHWGEWSEPKDVMGDQNVQMLLMQPKREESTAYLHYSMILLHEMLNEIGKSDASKECLEIAEGAKKAYQFHFVENDDIDSKRQAKLVRPLALGLLDYQTEKNVSKRLNESAIDREYRVGTGFLSTPFLLPMLAKHGYVDTAYQTLLNTKTPAWLGMIEQGATTVWESYEGFDSQDVPLETSMNHYSLGAMCAFLFEDVAGIHVIGERQFMIKPYPNNRIEFVKVSYQSPYGLIIVSWRYTDNGYQIKGFVPSNTSAQMILPNGKIQRLDPGNFIYNISV